MASFTESDIRYVIAEYRTLDELLDGRARSDGNHQPRDDTSRGSARVRRAETASRVRALIADGRLPQPTYVLPSGEARFPPDYFALVDEAGGVDALPARFRARYLAAATASPAPAADADEDWAGYLSGQFGVCLRSVTPEAMAEKNRLIRLIERLVAAPAEADPAWRSELRTAVDALDALERPFTDFDREQWGDTSRGRHIDGVRARYPIVFGRGAEGREPVGNAAS
jgi:hypothetical protein